MIQTGLRSSARAIRRALARPITTRSSLRSSEISGSAASATPRPTSVSDFLALTIKANGPISLANYMRQCLTNPAGGYYINRDPFGARGDFVTSPEISQMFGELTGIWVLAQWMAQGSPSKFRLVEFGPGRGTLMDDLLRAGRSFPQFANALHEVRLVEASPVLRNAQCQLLGGPDATPVETETGFHSKTKWGTTIIWSETARDLPRDGIPTFIVAHEFFDALPILQFEHTENGWRERVVDCKDEQSPVVVPTESKLEPAKVTKFHMTVNPHWTPSSKIIPETHVRYSKLPVGSKVEICPEAWDVSSQLGEIIEKCGGAALIIDYGPAETIPIETLRGIKAHKIVSPFENPGEADLSADVDFQAIKIAAKERHSVDAHGPVEQGDWLHTMGIGARASVLAKNQSTEEGQKRVHAAYNRLVEKSGGAMGKTYKVMALVPQGGAVPVGFGGEIV